MSDRIIEVSCPYHGTHEYVIVSEIPEREGVWCLVCWFESLGPSLPYRSVRKEDEDQNFKK
jgi:hypothetical protein